MYLGRANDYTDLLTEQARVAPVSCTAFDTDYANYFRISCATSLDLLKKAFSRIEQLVMTHLLVKNNCLICVKSDFKG
ncbi:MAG: hypothetical protein ABF682_10305 [Liquorilactobacillus sp.]|mgnify:CR=1 FL=1|uniref:hypothetical protein n=1 Tax=Liquorilactobacillus sp. TaxID=2767923 RepID=UPI0039ED0A5A